MLILVVAAGFAACQTNDKKSAATNSIPKEERDKAILDTANFTSIQWLDSIYKDMGKVPEGTMVEVAFRFKNSGTKVLIIDDVTAGCGCTVPEKPERGYAPGEEGVIKATFNSKGRIGENNKELYVTSNTYPKPQGLTFRVEVIGK